MQQTLKDQIELKGIGVHSGIEVNMRLLPAPVDVGIVFRRTDIENAHDIHARLKAVQISDLCTIIAAPEDKNNYVKTIEHLLAAFTAMGVDNAIVELDAAEVPIMDGSAQVFVKEILKTGLIEQEKERYYLKIIKEFKFEMGDSWAMFSPYEGTKFDVEIEFESKAIQKQKYSGELTPENFKNELAKCRTFGFLKDAQKYREKGFALGSSLDNAIIIDENDKVMNEKGLRYKDEFVRHKTLDAIGDLSLCGAALLGNFKSYKGGHRLNIAAVKELMVNENAWQWCTHENTMNIADVNIAPLAQPEPVAMVMSAK